MFLDLIQHVFAGEKLYIVIDRKRND